MTFKKIIKSYQPNKYYSDILKNNIAQSIFEYLILTTVVAAVVLFFSKSEYFTNIKKSCDDALDRSVTEIIK